MPRRGLRLNENGGETVQVEVRVNGILKYVRYATITESNNRAVRRYVTGAGDVLNINRSLGYQHIARQLL